MVAEALWSFGRIFPIAGKSFEESFSTQGTGNGEKALLFWYNDREGSTHMIARRIDGDAREAV
jgi:hypothetical protein